MKRMRSRAALLAAALVLVVAAETIAQDDIRTERVRFERGATVAVVESSITGYDMIDYVLGAREGQYMNVSMATDNGANYFNILAPGENEAAMFNGSMSQNQYEGVAPESGDYKIRVYMMRSAARRNEVANYRLEMIIGGEQPPAASQDAEVPAAADVPVAAEVPAAPEDGGPRNWEVTGVSDALNLREQPSTAARTISQYMPGTILHNLGCLRAENRVWCDVQELRGGPRGYVAAEFLTPAVSPDGSVATGPDTVIVTKPDGTTRAVYFMMGTAIGADTSEADGYGEFRANREADLTTVRVGDERYEIPDAVIYGG